MPYEDVKVQCKYCGAKAEGNQRFMLGGRRTLPGHRGRTPKWLKEKPEYGWIWNGLSDYIGDRKFSFDFYLCPQHTSQHWFNKAMKWAQEQIEGQRALQGLMV